MRRLVVIAVAVVAALAEGQFAASASAAPGARSVPVVVVSPSKGLGNAQWVRARVSGFGSGVKVFLSECLSEKYAAVAGCGPQTARQPFFMTDPDGNGAARFRVHSTASSRVSDTAREKRCESCVIVASGVSRTHHPIAAVTDIRFERG